MKNLLFVLLFILGFHQSQAQTKEEVLNCFQQIMNHPLLEKAFQTDFPEGRGIILIGNLNPSYTYQFRNNSNLWFVTQDDFYSFPQFIKHIRLQHQEELLELEGIEKACELNVITKGNKEQLQFYLNSFLKEKFRNYRWNFRFEKKGDAWQMLTSDEFIEDRKINTLKW